MNTQCKYIAVYFYRKNCETTKDNFNQYYVAEWNLRETSGGSRANAYQEKRGYGNVKGTVKNQPF